jgi:hypothetical protein
LRSGPGNRHEQRDDHPGRECPPSDAGRLTGVNCQTLDYRPSDPDATRCLTTPIEEDETDVFVDVNYEVSPSTLQIGSYNLSRVSNGVLLKPTGTTSYGNGTYTLYEEFTLEADLKNGVATVSGYAARDLYPDFWEPEISCNVSVSCAGTTQATLEGQP